MSYSPLLLTITGISLTILKWKSGSITFRQVTA
jgi:hypothetical protein